MEREEWESTDVCALCGEPVGSGPEGFAFGTGNVLCPRCAAARGGRYDTDREVWDAQPDVSGLRDEAYGAAPHERRRGR